MARARSRALGVPAFGCMRNRAGRSGAGGNGWTRRRVRTAVRRRDGRGERCRDRGCRAARFPSPHLRAGGRGERLRSAGQALCGGRHRPTPEPSGADRARSHPRGQSSLPHRDPRRDDRLPADCVRAGRRLCVGGWIGLRDRYRQRRRGPRRQRKVPLGMAAWPRRLADRGPFVQPRCRARGTWSDPPHFPLSGPEALDYREVSEVFESIGIWNSTAVTLTGGDESAARVPVALPPTPTDGGPKRRSRPLIRSDHLRRF